MWKPQAKTALMLARALEIIKSVAYEVSARWLFYRLLQESFYGSKDDYHNRFLPAISDARHEEYGGWNPFNLSYNTRIAILREDGYEKPIDWLSAGRRA